MADVTPVIVGVDVGGTNTDAVVISRKIGQKIDVLASVKRLTTSDVTSGVRSAVRDALTEAYHKGYKAGVLQVNLGTTHFVNAVVQRRGLAPVSVIRLCGTASLSLPPFSDCPEDLKQAICGSVHLVNGGYRYDGKIISEVDEEEIGRVLEDIRSSGVRNIVVSGVFSPVRADQEKQVADVIARRFPECSVTLSHTIGYLGILERENAAILNECLKPLCRKMVKGFRQILSDLELDCPLFLTQNDGTVIEASHALDNAVHLFASGPTNSMRGAAFLTGLKECLVLDIGGTTTDAGLLVKGFPRLASTNVMVAGTRTNFRLPDVTSIGLGGGSYVTSDVDDEGKVRRVKVGPLSAGFRLEEEALVFSQTDTPQSGRRLTTTDVAVASGLLQLGTPSRVASLDQDLLRMARDEIPHLIDDVIDRVRLSDVPLTAVLVGGGSVLVDGSRALRGCDRVLKPEHFGVANAVGAALCQVSGHVDLVTCLVDLVDQHAMQDRVSTALASLPSGASARTRQDAEEEARRPFLLQARHLAVQEAVTRAKEAAVQAGADPATLEVLENDEVSLAYLPGNVTHITVKVVGDLASVSSTSDLKPWTPKPAFSPETEPSQKPADQQKQKVSSTGHSLDPEDASTSGLTCLPSDPFIEPETGHWIISPWDVECLTVGTGLLGVGGGGSPYEGRLKLLRALKEGKKVRVVSPERLFREPGAEKGVVVTVGFMGAPAITVEQHDSGKELLQAVVCMQHVLSRDCYRKSTDPGVVIKEKEGVRYIDDLKLESAATARGLEGVVGVMSGEIGGLNGLEPLILATKLGLPVIDADGMGRAFPELQTKCLTWPLQMFGPSIYGVACYPVTLVDDTGRQAVLLYASSAKAVEDHLRQVTIEMGCSAGLCFFPLTKQQVMEHTVLRSMSHAWHLGNTVLRARLQKLSPVSAILASQPSRLLLQGKVKDVARETTGGFTKGRALVEGLDSHAGTWVAVHFQNENLIVRVVPQDQPDCAGPVLACTPDLIAIVDADTGHPVQTEEVRFGLRVAVIALGAPALMRTETALPVVGPQAFRYGDDVTYSPIGPPYAAASIPPL